jgi:hypothetical protein
MSISCSKHGTEDKYIQNLFRKLEGKCPFVKPRHRLKNNIMFDFRETAYEDVECIYVN